MIDLLGCRDYMCESCKELYRSHPAVNAFCRKCGGAHSLCDACWNVHLISASQEDHYLAELERQL